VFVYFLSNVCDMLFDITNLYNGSGGNYVLYNCHILSK
jgi:hypothetical protein